MTDAAANPPRGASDGPADAPEPTAPDGGSLEDVLADFLCRREAGEEPTVEEYQARHPRHAEALARLLAFDTVPQATKSDASTAGARRTAGEASRTAADATDVLPRRAASTDAADPAARPTLGPYEILAHVSTAGGGTVYRARDRRTDVLVALKTLDGLGGVDERDLERFRREASVVRSLGLVDVVPVLDAGEERGRRYLAMKWIDGETLRELRPRLVDPGHPLHDLRDRARLVSRLARTFAAVHAVHVVHRDVKPSNILVDRAYAPMILDFGIARAADLPELTDAGDGRLGTPRYLAPEIVARGNGAVSPAADVYGLGLVLYELATDVEPFAGVGRDRLYAAIANEGPVPPRRARPGLPYDLAAIVERAIAPDPRRRYPSMNAFAEDLDRFARGEPPARETLAGARPWARLWARRRRAVLAAAALAALVGTTAAYVYVERVRPELAARAAEEALAATAFLPPDASADGLGLDLVAAARLAGAASSPPARRFVAAWALHAAGRDAEVAAALAHETSFAARLLRGYALAALRQDEDPAAEMLVTPDAATGATAARSEVRLDREEHRRFALGAAAFDAAYAEAAAAGAPVDAVDRITAASLEWSTLPVTPGAASPHAIARLRTNLDAAGDDPRVAAAAAYLRGALLLLDGDATAARPWFLAAARGRDLVGAEYLAACCLVETGRAGDARDVLARVYARVGAGGRARPRVAARYAEAVAADDPDRAAALLAEALARAAAAPDADNLRAMLHAVRGEIAARGGDHAATRAAYLAALAVRPDWGPGYDRAAAAAEAAGDPEAAAELRRTKASRQVFPVPSDVETYLRLEWRGLRPPDRLIAGGAAVESPR